jgi:hypothetical protein
MMKRHDEARASRRKQYSLIAARYLTGELTLEILDLLGGKLRGEAAGGGLVVVEHCVPGLLLAAKPKKKKKNHHIRIQKTHHVPNKK